jgi:hypothetical protein
MLIDALTGLGMNDAGALRVVFGILLVLQGTTFGWFLFSRRTSDVAAA